MDRNEPANQRQRDNRFPEASYGKPPRPVDLHIGLWPECNLRCSACRENAPSKNTALKLYDLRRAIRQAHAMGIPRIVAYGAGEPLLHPRFREAISLISASGLRIALCTNGTLITETLAAFLYHHAITVIVRRDSAIASVQDELAGMPGASALMERGRHALFKAGYPDPEHGLGIRIAACRANQDEMPDLWCWARNHGITPYLECPHLTTHRSRTRMSGALSPVEMHALAQTLHSMRPDAKEPLYWPPLPAVRFLAHQDATLDASFGGGAPENRLTCDTPS